MITPSDAYLDEIEKLHKRATDVRKRGLARQLLLVGYSVTDVVGFLHKIFDTAIPKAELEAMRKYITIEKCSDAETRTPPASTRKRVYERSTACREDPHGSL